MKVTTLVSAILPALVLAQRPTNASVCDYYTTALFNASTAANQYTLLTALVNRALIGNFTPTAADVSVAGILTPGSVNGTAVNLLPYFNGCLASTNRGNLSVSVNFLDGGGAEPLKNGLPANSTTSNQFRLMTHLYQFFGKLLGCSGYNTTAFPAYQGRASQYAVHRFMGLTPEQIIYFTEQVGLSALSFGVAEEDVDVIGNALLNTFGYRCSPPSNVGVSAAPVLNSICANSTCPIDPQGNCALYPDSGISSAIKNVCSGGTVADPDNNDDDDCEDEDDNGTAVDPTRPNPSNSVANPQLNPAPTQPAGNNCPAPVTVTHTVTTTTTVVPACTGGAILPPGGGSPGIPSSGPVLPPGSGPGNPGSPGGGSPGVPGPVLTVTLTKQPTIIGPGGPSSTRPVSSIQTGDATLTRTLTRTSTFGTTIDGTSTFTTAEVTLTSTETIDLPQPTSSTTLTGDATLTRTFTQTSVVDTTIDGTSTFTTIEVTVTSTDIIDIPEPTSSSTLTGDATLTRTFTQTSVVDTTIDGTSTFTTIEVTVTSTDTIDIPEPTTSATLTGDATLTQTFTQTSVVDTTIDGTSTFTTIEVTVTSTATVDVPDPNSTAGAVLITTVVPVTTDGTVVDVTTVLTIPPTSAPTGTDSVTQVPTDTGATTSTDPVAASASSSGTPDPLATTPTTTTETSTQLVASDGSETITTSSTTAAAVTTTTTPA